MNDDDDADAQPIWFTADDHDEDLQRVRNALSGPGPGPRTGQSAALGHRVSAVERPVVMIPQLRDAYEQDPVEAVIDNIPPHEGADDIRIWNNGNQINRLVQHHERANERQNALWRNPVYAFVQLVNGFLLDQGSSTYSNSVDIDSVPFQVMIESNVSGAGGAPAPAAGAAGAASATGGAGAAGGAAQVGQFAVNELSEARRRDLDYKRKVDAVLNTTGVTGMSLLTPVMRAGIADALSSLRNFDMNKFENADFEHFLAGKIAMELFAKLVALQIQHLQMDKQTKYNKVVDMQRLRVRIREKCHEIYVTLIYNEREQGFVKSTSQQRIGEVNRLKQTYKKMKLGQYTGT